VDRENGLLRRPDLGQAPAHLAAARHALEVAGIGVEDVTTGDLFLCLPLTVPAKSRFMTSEPG
jgi:acetyl-CoA C-acetyltransferase